MPCSSAGAHHFHGKCTSAAFQRSESPPLHATISEILIRTQMISTLVKGTLQLVSLMSVVFGGWMTLRPSKMN